MTNGGGESCNVSRSPLLTLFHTLLFTFHQHRLTFASVNHSNFNSITMAKYHGTGEHNGITFNIENGGYGLSRGTADVNGKELVTEWAYRDETYSYQAIRQLIDNESK